jgi:hypothetical protein
LNEEISAILRSQYAIFRASIPKEQSDALRQSDASLETGTPPYEFIFNWTYKRINPAFISLYFNSYYYTGGANGIQTCFSVNYNNETGEFITLADLLGTDKPGWLEELSQTVRKQLEETINIAGDSVLTGMIEEGTTPDEKNFSVFVFDETTITLYFQKYQTAPGSFGILSAIKKRK